MNYRLGQQLARGFWLKFDVRHQFRNIDIFRRQARAKHVVRVGHHFQRHALQVGVRVSANRNIASPGFSLTTLSSSGEEAAIVRVELGDQADSLPGLTLFAVQRRLQRP